MIEIDIQAQCFFKKLDCVKQVTNESNNSGGEKNGIIGKL